MTPVFAVGNKGTILHYDGTVWSVMNAPTNRNLHGKEGVLTRCSRNAARTDLTPEIQKFIQSAGVSDRRGSTHTFLYYNWPGRVGKNYSPMFLCE